MNRDLLTIPQILAWADEFHARTGKWPSTNSGRISRATADTWCAIDLALRRCGRGLHAPEISLARLLDEQRGVRNKQRLPRFTVRRIDAWAIAHHDRTGTWPASSSGPILEAPGETWLAVDKALRKGARGLAGGSSLFQLLAERHQVRLHRRIPSISVEQILEWAKRYFDRFKEPPSQTSGRIAGTSGITWGAVDQMLDEGYRGLPGGSSLSLLLDGHFPVRTRHPPPLRIGEILRWARAFHRQHGKWPTVKSPGFAGDSGITWGAVHQALYTGCRGLPGGSSLSKLLRKHFAGARGVERSLHDVRR
ncbi:MAG TPA: hypothetical protein VGH74_05450 [Planctomycetaceae bacterium]|jgi:hypothetical protein